MGIYNALYTGSSGLSAFGESVRVIGDNIANINSLGFKSQNVVFSDVLSQTVGVTRSNIANQVGNGVRIGMITRDQQQGSIQNTTSATDMAINGNGMFALKDPASGQTYYTRAGSFILDKNSNLIDGQGFVVQGWATNEQGDATGNITDITFGGLASQAQPTTNVDVGVTLDSNAATYNAGVAFDPNNAATYHYKAEANIYDSLGQQHAVSVYYIKEANNTWSWQAGVDGADVSGGIPGQQVIVGNTATNFNTTNPALALPLPAGTEISGDATFDQAVTINGINVLAGQTVSAALGSSVVVNTSTFPAGTNVTSGNVLTAPASNQLVFGSQGELVTEVGPGINFPWNSAAVSTINFNFGDATTNDQQAILGDGLNGTVQMAGTFATRQIVRDGYASGFLDKLETDSTGRVFGVFTNGQRRSLYQVALAKFPNDAVLNHVGNNLQQETIASGSPILEKPGNGGMGSITPYGLEQSNVDLAGEFVKLIVVQRGYEANSKTISTTDQMLSSLMQIKR
ncbi:flagellar hook protein FlgE [Ghiorsea bivora]|uniref:flagellar hook protein FlgE n=1 Tax=Ghiorsea bivora TaxID=1485545 RepID=UPI00056F249D|nr:flagellar hook protein FlgE [Ghiorsea bivora]